MRSGRKPYPEMFRAAAPDAAEVETRHDPLEGMSLKERMEHMKQLCQNLVDDGILTR